MGRSFVLRQPGGALSGYLMTNRETLKLRASGIPAAGGEMMLVDARGAQSRRRLESTEQEQTLEGTGGEITAAYAIGGGRVIFASDAQAFQVAERALAGRMRAPAAEGGRQRAQPAPEDVRDRTASAAQRGVEHAAQDCGDCGEPRDADILKEKRRRREDELMQRRWPPPPCLMGARYEGGRWVTVTQRTSDTPGAPQRCDVT